MTAAHRHTRSDSGASSSKKDVLTRTLIRFSCEMAIYRADFVAEIGVAMAFPKRLAVKAIDAAARTLELEEVAA